MTARRPLALDNCKVVEIVVGDTLASDLVPSSSLGTFDGGSATVTPAGSPGIDGGGAS